MKRRKRPADVSWSTTEAPWAWKAMGVLPLSWLWNTSYLVRTAPLPLSDGGMVIPAYFELGRKYPVALRLDAQGGLWDIALISTAGKLLQPALLAMGERDWLALMRDGGPAGRIRLARTRDGGDQWADAGDLPLDNPDASVAALSAGGQHCWSTTRKKPAVTACAWRPRWMEFVGATWWTWKTGHRATNSLILLWLWSMANCG